MTRAVAASGAIAPSPDCEDDGRGCGTRRGRHNVATHLWVTLRKCVKERGECLPWSFKRMLGVFCLSAEVGFV